MSKTVKVGMVRSGFVADLHDAAFMGWVHNAEVIAVSSPHHAKKFAGERDIPAYYSDDREMLKDKEIDVVDIGIASVLHHRWSWCGPSRQAAGQESDRVHGDMYPS